MFICKRCNCSSKNNPCHLSKKDLKILSRNLTLLSVKSRLDLLFLLKDKSHCVCDLTTHTNMSQSLISHHLSDLTSAGLINNTREGKFVEYYLTPKGKILARMLMSMTSKMEGGENHNGQK